MNSSKSTTATLEDIQVNVRIKLAALWAALMFIYLYVDFFALYEPGALQHVLDGKVWVFDITQTWAMSALVLMTIPSLMVFLPLVLPPRVNRWTNIVVAVFYIVVAIGNPIGETWLVFWFGSAVEIVILALIVWYAWRWPKVESGS